MFKFNFDIAGADTICTGKDLAVEEETDSSLPDISGGRELPSVACVEVLPGYEHVADALFAQGPEIGGLRLKYISANGMKLSVGDFAALEETGSDLIPGQYEGGYKIWECTWDLITYASEESIDFSGKKVIDLGCGHGLCGIHALLRNADLVTFQDFNAGVLASVTTENVNANCSQFMCSAKFVAGSWSRLREWLAESDLTHKFDIVLTSETIYERQTVLDLAAAIRSSLRVGGVAYVAAKAFYFGVGGSPRDLRSALENLGVNFSWEEVRVIDASVKRVLIKITFV